MDNDKQVELRKALIDGNEYIQNFLNRSTSSLEESYRLIYKEEDLEDSYKKLYKR